MWEDGGSRSCCVSVRFLTVISRNFKRRSLVNGTIFACDDYHFAVTSRSVPHSAMLVGVYRILRCAHVECHAVGQTVCVDC